MISRTADNILKVCNQAHEESGSIKKELSAIKTKIANLTRTLETGLDSDSVRERVVELETQRKLLQQQLDACCAENQPVTREELIAELNADMEKIIHEPGKMRPLVQKYIVSVEISNDAIYINAIGDPILKKLNHQLLIGGLTTNGCGGPFTFVFTQYLPTK